MNTQTIDIVRNTLHFSSIVTIAIIGCALLAGLIRPTILKTIFHEFTERKYIVIAAIFTTLLSATILTATSPTNDTERMSSSSQSPITDSQVTTLVNSAQTQPTIPTVVTDITTTQVIPFATKTQDDPTMSVGQTLEVQAGKDGQKEQTYTVTKINDTETSRVLKNERVTVPPVDRVINNGTKQAEVITDKSKKAEPKKQKSSDFTCKNQRVGDSKTLICLPMF